MHTRLLSRLKHSLTEEGRKKGHRCQQVLGEALHNLADTLGSVLGLSCLVLFCCQREDIFGDRGKATCYDLQLLDSLVIYLKNSADFDF